MLLRPVQIYLRHDKREGLADVEAYLDRLPPIEAAMLRLYRDGVCQTEIARKWGLTQGGVHYRLAKAMKRIDFLRELPVLTRDEMDQDLAFIERHEDRDLLWRFYECNSQNQLAREIGSSQTSVRFRLMRLIDRIGDRASRDPSLGHYVAAFALLRKHPNVLSTFLLRERQ